MSRRSQALDVSKNIGINQNLATQSFLPLSDATKEIVDSDLNLSGDMLEAHGSHQEAHSGQVMSHKRRLGTIGDAKEMQAKSKARLTSANNASFSSSVDDMEGDKSSEGPQFSSSIFQWPDETSNDRNSCNILAKSISTDMSATSNVEAVSSFFREENFQRFSYEPSLLSQWKSFVPLLQRNAKALSGKKRQHEQPNSCLLLSISSDASKHPLQPFVSYRTSQLTESQQKQYIALRDKIYKNSGSVAGSGIAALTTAELNTWNWASNVLAKERAELAAEIQSFAERYYAAHYQFISPHVADFYEQIASAKKSQVALYARYYQIDKTFSLLGNAQKGVSLKLTQKGFTIGREIIVVLPQKDQNEIILDTPKQDLEASAERNSKASISAAKSKANLANDNSIIYPGAIEEKVDFCPVSQDPHVLDACKRENVDIALSASAFKALFALSPSSLAEEWDIPFAVKVIASDDQDEHQKKRVLFLDKPLLKRKLSLREKNMVCMQRLFMQLLQFDNSNGSLDRAFEKADIDSQDQSQQSHQQHQQKQQQQEQQHHVQQHQELEQPHQHFSLEKQPPENEKKKQKEMEASKKGNLHSAFLYNFWTLGRFKLLVRSRLHGAIASKSIAPHAHHPISKSYHYSSDALSNSEHTNSEKSSHSDILNVKEKKNVYMQVKLEYLFSIGRETFTPLEVAKFWIATTLREEALLILGHTEMHSRAIKDIGLKTTDEILATYSININQALSLVVLFFENLFHYCSQNESPEGYKQFFASHKSGDPAVVIYSAAASSSSSSSSSIFDLHKIQLGRTDEKTLDVLPLGSIHQVPLGSKSLIPFAYPPAPPEFINKSSSKSRAKRRKSKKK